ncbi:MAG: hypothetical protein JNG88_06835 [Phycisphaerales bacterium]|nr:hypothetical protein [Phycisphaerales bacterium]
MEQASHDSQPGSDSAPSPAIRPAELADQEFYCLECGYNLRGLTGDPIRCPECGRENPLWLLTVPAPIISRQFAVLETSSAYSVLMLLLFLVSCVLFPWLTAGLGKASIARIAIVTCAFLGGAIVSLHQSRATTDNHPAWPLAIFRYHFFGILLFVGFFAELALASWATLGPRRVLPIAWTWLITLIVIVLQTRWLYRAAIRDLRAIQRNMAVRIAARELDRWFSKKKRQ